MRESQDDEEKSSIQKKDKSSSDRSDDAGSVMVEQIKGEYEPWFTPVLENWLGKEIPEEIESLLFCLQTGIGVGIIAFYLGRFVERKKWQNNK